MKPRIYHTADIREGLADFDGDVIPLEDIRQMIEEMPVIIQRSDKDGRTQTEWIEKELLKQLLEEK